MTGVVKIGTIRIIQAVIVTMLMTDFSSCDSCGDYALYYNRLVFRVFSKTTGENVMYIGTSVYNYDTVKIYNDNWEVVYPGPVGADGLFSLAFIDQSHDKGLIGQLIERRFFLYYNFYDVDTIDIGFKTEYNHCEHQVINYFKTSYNGSEYFDSACDKVPSLEFLK